MEIHKRREKYFACAFLFMIYCMECCSLVRKVQPYKILIWGKTVWRAKK